MKILPICSLIGSGFISMATAADNPVDLGAVDIINKSATTTATNDDNSKASTAYESFDPENSGLSVVNQKGINKVSAGGIDTSELLKILPFVQMDEDRNRVNQANEQSIRPSNFSISGGNYYDNNIMIDGIGVNSVMDVAADTNPSSVNNVAGQTAQTLYVDPSLLESIEVFDSNVSAKYGNFVGGAVNMNLRKPKEVFSVGFAAGIQNDSMKNYIYSDEFKDDIDNNPPPEFIKYNTAISVDIPFTEKFKTLWSYSRSVSEVDYDMDDAYGGLSFTNGDTSENFMLKAVYQFSDTLDAEAQVSYSPYTSGYDRTNAINSHVDSNSTGLSTYFKLSGINGDMDWEAKLAYTLSDTSRKAASYNYVWPSNYADWCSRKSCTDGSFGNLDQKQKDYTASFTGHLPLWEGDISFGTDLTRVEASKIRDQDSYSYNYYKKVPGATNEFVCAIDDDACKEKLAILNRRSIYQAYDAEVNLNSLALWTEYQRQFGNINLRTGLRYDHENFLSNHNISPRITANWEFYDEMFLTVGANRYYTNSMLAYAIRSQMPDDITDYRDINADGTVGDWYEYRRVRNTDYGTSDLKTPYSDELTAAITLPTPLEGSVRLKAVYRWNRDLFAKEKLVDFNTSEGSPKVNNYYVLNNDGATDYRGISLEWAGHYQDHHFNANINWSQTKTVGNATSYDSQIDPSEDSTTYVYYKGQLITKTELYDIEKAQNFAAPVKAFFSWSTDWFSERLSTTARMNYRGKYTSLSDSGENMPVDGSNYDIYERTDRKAFTSVDFNASYRLAQIAGNWARVDIKLSNLFNDLPHTKASSSMPYQQGRSYWLYLKYDY
ncbi:TonB-dependent receptor plug domain-containing protein [Shewanella psychrotolerans]|uniref:TonB-dependent receptor plug domain-containing protein n=1 Tax=Shewanella psychrotolerans TaxID=2864206 RepID=UPI001C6569FD|nr:TonB-dependent receptor plug domain-containing protein [Shewanella psychrotolerans]QYK00735.1 TonB-dependent receptor plug domain-containing protein [Shewanella psychrotolerans]